MAFGEFLTFLEKIDITQMVIGLVISGALANLVTALIEEFVNPWIPQMDKQKIIILGKEINLGKILAKLMAVLASLVFAFIIFSVFKPSLDNLGI